jgi:hypothetical protein
MPSDEGEVLAIALPRVREVVAARPFPRGGRNLLPPVAKKREKAFITAAAFSADGKLAVSGTALGRVTLREMPDGFPVRSFEVGRGT